MKKKKSFYGWVIVAACFILTMFPMVFVSNTLSYYQYPICNEMGVSYVEFNVASVCSTIASMAFSFLLAGKMARGNMQRWMLAGASWLPSPSLPRALSQSCGSWTSSSSSPTSPWPH